MFEDSLIESGNKLKTKRLATSIVSFFGQFLLLGILILIPLIYTESLPKTQLMTFLVAPPPPPPPQVAQAGETENRMIKIIAKESISGFLMARDYTYDFVSKEGICIGSLMEFTNQVRTEER